jgi:hypothetical protein
MGGSRLRQMQDRDEAGGPRHVPTGLKLGRTELVHRNAPSWSRAIASASGSNLVSSCSSVRAFDLMVLLFGCTVGAEAMLESLNAPFSAFLALASRALALARCRQLGAARGVMVGRLGGSGGHPMPWKGVILTRSTVAVKEQRTDATGDRLLQSS